MEIKSIGVFCGSSMGSGNVYREGAAHLGKALAMKNVRLVYGGANIGLMKVVADAVLEHGGRVIGVMPEMLIHKEIAHAGLDELIKVNSMHERKAQIAAISDAFIAMPGGFGTLDELAEVLSWNQLEIIHKPIALFNIHHYFDHLITFLDICVRERFLRIEHRSNIVVGEDAAQIINNLLSFIPVRVDSKWVDELKKM